jgi:hypothetical protein
MNKPASNEHIHSSSCRTGKDDPPVGTTITGKLLKFSGWFFGFAGLFAMGSVCPFCGQQGCPVGAASAGIVGLTFASLFQWGNKFPSAIKTLLRLK